MILFKILIKLKYYYKFFIYTDSNLFGMHIWFAFIYSSNYVHKMWWWMLIRIQVLSCFARFVFEHVSRSRFKKHGLLEAAWNRNWEGNSSWAWRREPRHLSPFLPSSLRQIAFFLRAPRGSPLAPWWNLPSSSPPQLRFENHGVGAGGAHAPMVSPVRFLLPKIRSCFQF